MTALEVYDLTTKGGGSDFARVIEACRSIGPYCLNGGMAVNCFVEPVYTLDADLVVVSSQLEELVRHLRSSSFTVEVFEHSINVQASGSQLRIQFTTDWRYQDFLLHSSEKEVLGEKVQVASLEDVTKGKLWAYSDPRRQLTKRKKDELDLIRLAEAYPQLKAMYPADLVDLLSRG